MKNRRRWTMPTYRGGCCQDCGNLRPVTTVIFWATGYRYRVCGDCIEAYRAVILKPCPRPCPVCPS